MPGGAWELPSRCGGFAEELASGPCPQKRCLLGVPLIPWRAGGGGERYGLTAVVGDIQMGKEDLTALPAFFCCLFSGALEASWLPGCSACFLVGLLAV